MLGWKSMTTSYDIIMTMLRLALIHSVFKTPRAHTINPVFSPRLCIILSPLSFNISKYCERVSERR